MPSQAPVTVTATDSAGNTSEFSAVLLSETLSPATVTIPAEYRVSEARSFGSDGTVQITVTRTGRNDQAAHVAYTTVPGTATPGTDHTPVSGTLIWRAGDQGQPQIEIPIVDNPRVDGDRSFSIRLRNVQGTEVVDGLTSTVTIVDDDRAGLIAAPVTHTDTYEANQTPARFVFRLTSQTSASVSFNVGSSDAKQGVVNVSRLVFTPGDWSIDQYVLVTGVDDFIADPRVSYSFLVSPTESLDPLYNGLTVAPVTLTNIDDDYSGFLLSDASNLVTSEDGGTAQFTVRLRSQPTARVRIPLTSSDSTEGLPDRSELFFDPSNWDIPQTVTVQGLPDDEIDWDLSQYAIFLGPFESDDPYCRTTSLADIFVPLTNRDIDVAGLVLTPAAGLVTTDTGGTATFTVRLASRPLAPVGIPVASSDPRRGTTDLSTLVFDRLNWHVRQTVTVRGAINRAITGDAADTVLLGPPSSDEYALKELAWGRASLVQRDTITLGLLLNPGAGLVVAEGGGTANFTARLGSQPSAAVRYRLVPTDPSLVQLSAPELSFTPDNWDIHQTVVVTGLHDQIAQTDQAFAVIATPVTADPQYAGLAPVAVNGVHRNGDVARIIVTPGRDSTTGEDGRSTTVAVRLASRPLGAVRVPVRSTNPAEGQPRVAELVFAPDDWSVDQTVTVVGVADAGADGSAPYAIQFGPVPTEPGAEGYAGLSGSPLALGHQDDAASVVVVPASPSTTTNLGGTAQFAVRLRSRPFAPVGVSFRSSDPSRDVVVNPFLIFTPDNWDVSQMLVVSGARNDLGSGAAIYTVAGVAQSLDLGYNGLPTAPLSLTQVNLAPTAPAAALVATVTVRKRKTPTLALQFGNALNPASVANLDHYQLVSAGRDGKFGTRDDVRVRVTTHAYDPTTRTVRLTPAPLANLGTARLQLTVRAGLLDADNQAIDGNRDVRAGGDALIQINRKRATLQ